MFHGKITNQFFSKLLNLKSKIMRKNRQSEAAILENYRVALENVKTQKQIADAMLEIGYDEKVISEGRTLLQETFKNYQNNKTEDAERSESYNHFISLWDELDNIYTVHRKKAKVIFRNEPAVLEQLGINGKAYPTFVSWIQIVKNFYNVLSKEVELQNRLLRLKLTVQDIQNSNTKLNKLEKARADYVKEKGESQNATQLKDEAFRNIDLWMRDFYAVARIALEDNPQLLEALSKTVKN